MKTQNTDEQLQLKRRAPVLAELNRVNLSGRHLELFESARQSVSGPPVWRRRKLAEAHDILALSKIAPRFDVVFIDLRETLRVGARMRVPVPLQPDEMGRLRTASEVLLGLMYPEQAIRSPLPGYAFIQIMAPAGVWHANVSVGDVQMLCLGAQLPIALPLKEIVIMSFGAITMQSVMIDETDPAGVLNVEAARWWQHHIDLIPLSRASFLDHEPYEDDKIGEDCDAGQNP